MPEVEKTQHPEAERQQQSPMPFLLNSQKWEMIKPHSSVLEVLSIKTNDKESWETFFGW